MGFLVVVGVLLALSYAGAAVHAKVLLNKGDNRGDVERTVVNTGASIMVVGVIVSLLLWPAGKTPWYKSQLFLPVYKLTATYLKPDAKKISKAEMKGAEETYVIIRQVLIGAVTSVLCGILAQLLIQSQAKKLTETSFSAPGSKGPRSPWTGSSY